MFLTNTEYKTKIDKEGDDHQKVNVRVASQIAGRMKT